MSLGLEPGGMVICDSLRGSYKMQVEVTDALTPGVMLLPLDYGRDYSESSHGSTPLKELTDSAHCDEVAETAPV